MADWPDPARTAREDELTLEPGSAPLWEPSDPELEELPVRDHQPRVDPIVPSAPDVVEDPPADESSQAAAAPTRQVWVRLSFVPVLVAIALCFLALIGLGIWATVSRFAEYGPQALWILIPCVLVSVLLTWFSAREFGPVTLVVDDDGISVTSYGTKKEFVSFDDIERVRTYGSGLLADGPTVVIRPKKSPTPWDPPNVWGIPQGFSAKMQLEYLTAIGRRVPVEDHSVSP